MKKNIVLCCLSILLLVNCSLPETAVSTGDRVPDASALQAQLIAVYETVSPSVVSIHTRARIYDTKMRVIGHELGMGAGFVYDGQGHILTNYHVVKGAEKVSVTLADGRTFEAQVVGTDPATDLAALSIGPIEDLPAPIPLADSEELRVGQFVVAIGCPFGLEQTLTSGVISALGRVIHGPEDNRAISQAIQTDAAINPGNSGGPLLDLKGRVISVNSQLVGPTQVSIGIGFAVSSNTVRRMVEGIVG